MYRSLLLVSRALKTSHMRACAKFLRLDYISDVINKAAALPPNTPLEKYRMLLPDKWKENR